MNAQHYTAALRWISPLRPSSTQSTTSVAGGQRRRKAIPTTFLWLIACETRHARATLATVRPRARRLVGTVLAYPSGVVTHSALHR